MTKRLRYTKNVSLLVLVIFIIMNLGLVSQASNDEYDTMREKWKAMLTGGTACDPLDVDIANQISALTATAQANWDSMDKSIGRTYLWSDLNSTTLSSQITSSYSRLKSMALAYSTKGSSLENNTTLLNDLISGLDWMYTNRYNENVLLANQYDNWWDWKIGVPLNLNDIVVLLYSNLTATQINNYMTAVAYFKPGTTQYGPSANRAWSASISAVYGVIVKNGTAIGDGKNALSAMFSYVNSGDGFYGDGSYLDHSYNGASFSYTGGYGAALLSDVANLIYLVSGSTWGVTDTNVSNMYKRIYDSFEPLIYKGAMMNMVRGREISRYYSEDHVSGQSVIQSIIRISQFAPQADASAFKSMVKYFIQEDTYRNFMTYAKIEMIILGKTIINDANVISRGELIKTKIYPRMDRAVDLRPGFGFGISMSSTRIFNYEAINGENIRGWNTGAGMTYLYNNDLGQYSGGFWPTVNAYRLPGTTIQQNTTNGQRYTGTKDWVGGTEILGIYGAVGMELLQNSSLAAKKSWFMFDDEIVALGSAISGTNGKVIETVVENRKLNGSGNNALTVNGTTKSSTLGWSETMSNVNSIHLAGSVFGSDIGYYFSDGTATINGLREARTGKWSDIDSRVGVPTDNITNNYLTLWYDHGVNPSNTNYSYVILPNKTAAQVSNYAVSPNITVLENSGDAQAVKENTLNVTGVNFWSDIIKTVGGITSDKKASVMTNETVNDMSVSVSDPTQLNTGNISIEINKAATSTLSADPGITVTQLSPTIKFTVNVNAAKGKTFKAMFSFTTQPIPATPTLSSAISGNTQVDLAWTSVSGATGYKVKYGTVSGSYTTTIDVGNVTGNTVTGLTNGTPYFFVVSAYNTAGESTNSNQLSATPSVPLNIVIVDNADVSGVTKVGTWNAGTVQTDKYGTDYIHDNNTGKGTKSVTLAPNLPTSGNYKVYMWWPANTNRATNVPVDILHAGVISTVTINQQVNGGVWNLLGTYTFNAGTTGNVKIRNDLTNGYVIADAVKFESVP